MAPTVRRLAPFDGRAPRPVALVVRVVPVARADGSVDVAGELEVVDTGDHWTFNDASDLLARLAAVLADQDR